MQIIYGREELRGIENTGIDMLYVKRRQGGPELKPSEFVDATRPNKKVPESTNEAKCQTVVFSGPKEQVMLSALPIRVTCDAFHRRGMPILRIAQLRYVHLGRISDPAYPRFGRGMEFSRTSWSVDVAGRCQPFAAGVARCNEMNILNQ